MLKYFVFVDSIKLLTNSITLALLLFLLFTLKHLHQVINWTFTDIDKCLLIFADIDKYSKKKKKD